MNDYVGKNCMPNFTFNVFILKLIRGKCIRLCITISNNFGDNYFRLHDYLIINHTYACTSSTFQIHSSKTAK